MSPKLPVHFSKTVRTAHLFQRLKQCRRCGAYSCLAPERCPSCRVEGAWIALPDAAETVSRRGRQIDLLVLGIFAAGGIAVARSFIDVAIAIAGVGLLAFLYIKLRKNKESYLYRRILRRILLQERQKIRQGLLDDITLAEESLKADDYKSAYEQFREIGFFLKDNPLRLLRLLCLEHFVLRSDMELELNALIPDGFRAEFIAYLLEIGRVKPQLIDRETLAYVDRHRGSIENLPYGGEVLTAAAGAALRVKAYVDAYRSLVFDYAELLPKERLLRLQRIARERGDADPALLARVQDIADRRFGGDPEFQDANTRNMT